MCTTKNFWAKFKATIAINPGTKIFYAYFIFLRVRAILMDFNAYTSLGRCKKQGFYVMYGRVYVHDKKCRPRPPAKASFI